MKIDNTIMTQTQKTDSAASKGVESESAKKLVSGKSTDEKIVVNDNKAASNANHLQAVEGEDPKQLQEAMQERLKSLVEKLNKNADKFQRDLVFTVHEETGRSVVTVSDAESGKVVRQIPSEETLKLAEKLEEFKSLLVDTQV